jgi:hypothetical protein
MSRRPLTTPEDFLKVRQDFNQILAIHVSYAFSYFTLLQCNVVEHSIVDIWEDLDILRFLQHGEYPPQVTSCRNPSLGLATKARACKVAGQEGSPGVTSHIPGSAKECEGMNLHTLK